MRNLAHRIGRPVPLVIAVATLAGCAGPPASKPLLHADLSEGDIMLAATTMDAALEHASHGETRTWRNPGTGHAGAVMPRRTYLSEAGLYCRDYQETLTVNDRSATYEALHVATPRVRGAGLTVRTHEGAADVS
jgi:surface antigen